jgi:molybdopterin-guanine dinucleotide biosynthesis protein A
VAYAAVVIISFAVSSDPLHAANNRTAASKAAVTIRVFPIRLGLDIVLLLVGCGPASPPTLARYDGRRWLRGSGYRRAMDQPIVAVLAGGDSTRMGFDKAMAPIGVSTMLETVIDAVAPIGDVVVVGRTAAPGGTPSIADRRRDARGPLTGLETAMSLNPGRTVVLVAVDHPFVRHQTLRELLMLDGDAIVPFDDGWQQVTCAVYRPTFLAAATDILDNGGRSIITALDRVDTRLVAEQEWNVWNEDGRSWFSVDSQERLEAGLRRYG